MPPQIRSCLVPVLLALTLAIAPAAALDLSVNNPPATTPTISQGDSVFVHGIATGHPQPGLQVWVLGNNYARVTTVSVENDNSYEYEITKAETQAMATGQYFVLIQHPMMNGEFDIVYNAGTGQVINRRLLDSTGAGTVIFQLTGAGSLQGPAAASALIRAVGSQNIDDTFSTVTFMVAPPDALVDPIPAHAVGDRFTITGTTNLAVGDRLQVDVYSSSFKPTSKSGPSGFSGASGVVEIQRGTGSRNRWSFDIDASTFAPDEYIVSVQAIVQDVKGSSTFWIVEKTPSPSPSFTGRATAAPPASAGSVATAATEPLFKAKKTPLPAILVPAGIIAALALARIRRKV